jgi:hypothetical protein
VQSQFVKFRIRPDLKGKLQEAAKHSHTSVSAIVRRAAIALAEGRSITRYNKTALSFISFLCLAAAKLWFPSFVNRP